MPTVANDYLYSSSKQITVELKWHVSKVDSLANNWSQFIKKCIANSCFPWQDKFFELFHLQLGSELILETIPSHAKFKPTYCWTFAKVNQNQFASICNLPYILASTWDNLQKSGWKNRRLRISLIFKFTSQIPSVLTMYCFPFYCLKSIILNIKWQYICLKSCCSDFSLNSVNSFFSIQKFLAC